MNRLITAFIFTVVALIPAWAEPSITVQDKSYAAGSTVNEWAQYTIDTAGTVTVGNDANVSFSAGSSIKLYPGFKVEAGAVFQAAVSSYPSYNPGGYYNGITPTLALIAGDQQYGQAGQFNLHPFDIAIWNTAGTAPLVNAPVLLTVSTGGGWLAATNGPNAVLSKTLLLTTDVDGTVHGYYQQGTVIGVTSTIQVVAGSQTWQFTTFSINDTTAPSVPTGLFADTLTSTSFRLNWTASTDNVGVVGYDVYKNGALLGSTTTATNYSVTGLAQATSYTMTVKAKDAANNVSAASSPLVITIGDSDSNGLADSWELAFFGATGVSPSGDPDGDGLTNLQEYQQGRLPSVSDAAISFYIDGNNGSDASYNGRSAWPGMPSGAYGPKQTLHAAITAASTGDSLAILTSTTPYVETTLSLTGKDLVLRPVGNVTIQP